MAKFRKKPVIVEAVQWKGGDYKILDEFCGKNWGRADAIGAEYWPSEIADSEQVMLFNIAERTWLPCPTGWWIIRGVVGELYPCKPYVFTETYEPI